MFTAWQTRESQVQQTVTVAQQKVVIKWEYVTGNFEKYNVLYHLGNSFSLYVL